MATDAEEKSARNNNFSKKCRRCIMTIGLVLLLLSFTGVLPKTPTSILCDDPSISRIYEHDTIPMSVLLLMASITPFINILLIEWALPRKSGRDFRNAVRTTWGMMKHVLYCEIIIILVMEFFKMAVSEARPHFLQTCKPDLTQELCDKGYVEISWDNCTNPQGLSKGRIMDTMKSFPSGHAGLGAFISTVMIWYLATRVQVAWSQYLPVWASLAWGLWGAVCGLSRIWDNRHHWWDVAAGTAMGLFGAYLTIRYVSRQLAILSASRSSLQEREQPPSQP